MRSEKDRTATVRERPSGGLLDVVCVNAALNAGVDLTKRRWITLVPDGEVECKQGDFVVDAQGAELAMKAFEAHGVELPIDYEHQTLGGPYSSPDGRAPAAGWIKTLDYTPEIGLRGFIEWNEEAAREIAAKRYRYLSPVAIVRKSDRKMVGLHSVALTNVPAIAGMRALAASERFGSFLADMEVITMADEPTGAGAGGEGGGGGDATSQAALLDALKELVATIRSVLGLAEDASSEQILEAIQKLKEPKAEGGEGGEGGGEGGGGEVAASVRRVLNLPADAGRAAIVAAVERATAHVGHVPVSQYNVVVERVAALENANKQREAEELVAANLQAGKLNSADKQQMAWACKTAAADAEAFKVIMANAPVIIPQGKTQPPAGGAGQPGSRTAVIAASTREYRGDQDVQALTSLKAFLNESLREGGHDPLSEKEAVELTAA